MDPSKEKILIAAKTLDGRRFSIYLHNLIVIGIRKNRYTYEFCFQRPPNGVSDLWWGSTTQLIYRCGDEDYAVQVPNDTGAITTEIRPCKKLVLPYSIREEGKEIILTPNASTQQTTTDEAQALGNTIPGAFPVEVDEATNTIQIYFTTVDPEDYAFSQANILERVSNITDSLQHKSVETRINMELNSFRLDTTILNSAMFNSEFRLFHWKSTNDFSPLNGTDGDDSIYVGGTVSDVLSKIRKYYSIDGSDIPVRICVSLVLDRSGLSGLFRIYPTCNAALIIAARNGHDGVVKILLEKGAKVNQRDAHGLTALSWAILAGHDAVVSLLLKGGASFNDELIEAARGNHVIAARILVHNGAKIDQRDAYGFTALSWASWEGHEAIAELLLQAKANVNDALIFAARGGHDCVVKILLKNGAEVNQCGVDGLTALSWANRNGHDAVEGLLLKGGASYYNRLIGEQKAAARGHHDRAFGILVDNGAKMYQHDADGFIKLSWGNREGHEVTAELRLPYDATVNKALIIAARSGHDGAVKILLDNGAKVSHRDVDGLTALSWAHRNGHDAVVGLLLKGGTSFNDELFEAARENYASAARILVHNGAKVDQRDSNGLTALSWAVQKGHETVVGLLIDASANVNAITYGNLTPLMLAAQNGHNAVAALLLKAGASVNDIGGSDYTLLILAAQEGHEGAVKTLLANGADVNQHDEDGFTALSWASWNGHNGVVELLVEAGAGVNNVGEVGYTPLILAAQEGHDGVVMTLLANSADVNQHDEDGFTALSWASWNGHNAVVELLVEAGAGVNDVGEGGYTPLILAAQEGHDDVVNTLLANGADVNQHDEDGFTALSWASRDGHNAVVELLVEAGASVNDIGEGGYTPLILAAQEGHDGAVTTLLANGADVGQHDADDFTALSWASWNGHNAVVELLVEAGAGVNDVGEVGSRR